MGGMCSSDGTNSQIKHYMDDEEANEACIIKLLLLGPGATGKSTLFKSLQIINSGKIEDGVIKIAADIIRQNIVIGIMTLVHQSHVLYSKNPEKYRACQFILPENEEERKKIETAVSVVSKYQNGASFSIEIDIKDDDLSDLSNAVELLWSLPHIKATFVNHGRHFAFSDNLEYFFDNVDRMMDKNYIVSDQDCLKNRTKTTGMHQYIYDGNKSDEKLSTKFHVIDVGGQRAERRKWVQYFDK